MVLTDEQKAEARLLIANARINRFFALVFALGGLAVFMMLYFRYINGGMLDALKRPSTVMIILIPFLPAAILARKSSKLEKQFHKLIGSETGKKD